MKEAWGNYSINCQMLPTEAQAVMAQEESKGRRYIWVSGPPTQKTLEEMKTSGEMCCIRTVELL